MRTLSTLSTVRRTGATLTGAAAVAAIAVAPAQADVSAAGMTVQGNNFQVGQTYTVTATDNSSGYHFLMDTVNGVTMSTGTIMGYSNPLTADWVPVIPGTHSLSEVSTPFTATNWWQPLPDAITPGSGPVSVTVAGTATTTGYTSCAVESPTYQGCMTVQGTPQVGCTLTITTTHDAFPVGGLTNGLSGIPTPSGSVVDMTTAQSESDPITDNGQTIGAIQPGKGTTSIKWTPTTTGNHHLHGDGTWSRQELAPLVPFAPSIEFDLNALSAGISGIPIGITPETTVLGDTWMSIAPAGTGTCA